jgi:predicted transcriptional regulator
MGSELMGEIMDSGKQDHWEALEVWVNEEAEQIKEDFEELVKRFWEYMYLMRGHEARVGKKFSWRAGCRYREGRNGGDLRWFVHVTDKRHPIRDATYKKALANSDKKTATWMRKIESEAEKIRHRRKALEQINARIKGYRQIKENAATKSEMEEIVRMCEEG